jgi:hypothetical protein
MPCQWLYLASKNSPEHFCTNPGHPYCPDHEREMNLIHSVDDDWKAVEHKPFCDEQKEDKERKR